MFHIEILRHDNAVRVTDTETHWTRYFRAEKDKGCYIGIDDDNPNFLRIVSRKYSSGILVETDMVAAFPLNMTFITDDSETNP